MNRGRSSQESVLSSHGGSTLPPPPPGARSLTLAAEALPAVRSMAAELGAQGGLSEERVDDLLIVAHELASNALDHGVPPRQITMWQEPGSIVCDVRNRGGFSDPRAAGKRRPATDAQGGLGLWIVNQLCRLLEVHTGKRTAVRAHLHTG